ncbi:PREDICTED: glutamate receptor 4-like [Acropora digitifera]|uniref:glutamate receptor 4-like n=1 Tax=Acropora digitifera TaxID=70779 RepID=UPI00077AEC03|nr:PREDICTED: glutamate receptor 4-like [Acropora digitifera]
MKIFSLAREMEKFEVDAIPQLKMNDEEKFRHAMEVLPKSGANYVLVLSKPENLAKILEKAIHLGAINKKSRWFALDMDFKGNISKKCFKGLVGLKVNLTHQGREQERKKTSEIILALLNDTLHAIAEAFRKGESKIVKGNGSCFDAKKSSLESGREMLKNLNQVKFNGRTGLVRFDNKTKSRMVQRLDIVNVQVEEGEDEITRSVLKNQQEKNKPVQLNYLKAIDWTGEFWQELQCSVKTKKGKAKKLQGRKITVVTIEDSPFCQKKPNQTKSSERGHGYEGFSIDLLERIQKLTGFQYELKISKEGKMNSLITDLVNKKAHVAIGAITITATRELDVDFSKPFMDFKISLLMQKSTEEELNLFAFLLPFEMMVWLSTIAVVIGVTFLIYCLDYFSPNGYRATAIASGEGEGDEFNIFNSLWFAAGSILQQGADNTPKCASGRILAGAFWFFTMILISTYTANLAAYFTGKAKSYGIGLQRRSDLTNPFSVAILKLRESGEVKKLREKWWTHRSDCPDPKLPAAVTTMRISLDHMAGVFIVLAAGILVSIVFLIIERRCHNLRKEVKNSGSMMSVRDQMDQPTVSTAPVHFPRRFSMESKAMNNMDQHRKGDSRDGPGSRANDNLTVPKRNPRLPNVYAGAQESNL